MRILGIIGHPVAHSYSPVVHNAALKAVGLEQEFVYLPFDIPPENLRLAVEAFKVLGIKGVSVTMPHKETVIPFLDELDDQAKAVQAVNVIVNDDHKLIGYNTDGIGFTRSLKEDAGVDPAGKKVFILGAGGAAKSICAALASTGAKEIVVANRTLKRAEAIEEMIRKLGMGTKIILYEFPNPHVDKTDDLKEQIRSAEIIINTTSVGLYPPDQSLLTGYQDMLHQDQLVADVIYTRETLLLKQAKKKGCPTLSGAGMLVYQGVEAFRMWTGVDAPVEIMREVLEEQLKRVDKNH
jgi:shikimate dehydrogenase